MGEGKSGLLLPFAGFIVILLLIAAIFVSGIPASSAWTASNTSSPGNVVIATATWTTTNEYGNTVTYSGLVTSTASTTSSCVWPWCQATTTSSSTSSTTSTAATPWIRLTLHGTYQITDKDGNVVYTNTFEWAPIGGSGNGTHIKYDVTYDVKGQGIDWTTLTVNVNVNGLTAQPSIADPNTPEILNQVDNVESISGAKTQNGRLGKLLPIDTLLGGKTVDKARMLSTAIAVTGTANAKLLPGYSLLGGNTVAITTGPVIGLSNMKWKETVPPTPPPTPPPVTPPPVTPPYVQKVVTGAGRTCAACELQRRDKPTNVDERFLGYKGVSGIFRGAELLGLNSAVEIYGWNSELNLDSGVSDTFLGLVIAIIVVAVVIICWKKKTS